MSVVLGIVLFAGGVVLLVAAVERLAAALTAWAAAAGLSGAALAAVVLGADLESTAAGVSGTLNGVPEVVLGASVGSAVLLLTLGLGLAGVVSPFRVAPPLRLLAATALGIALAAALMLDGRVNRADGALLVAGFAFLLATLVLPALRDAAGERSGEPVRGHALTAVLALAALIAGAELLVLGTERIVDDLGIAATFFGLVVVAVAVSLEELVLEMLPAYRGAPEISVGNALGTTLFMLTGSLGVVALVRPFAVPDAVRELHLPALAIAFLLAGALLARGGVGRAGGALLVAAYPLYVTLAALTG
jgi:cation:H+ antiporter